MMRQGSNLIIESLILERKKLSLREFLLSKAILFKDLHDAILNGNQKFLNNFLKNYSNKTELSWYDTDTPFIIDRLFQYELKQQDRDIAASF